MTIICGAFVAMAAGAAWQGLATLAVAVSVLVVAFLSGKMPTIKMNGLSASSSHSELADELAEHSDGDKSSS